MKPRHLTGRRALFGGAPIMLASVLVASGTVAPAPTTPKPILESKVHALSVRGVPPGWSASVDTALPTQAIAFDWDGSAEGAVEVRALEGRTWGPWVRVEGNPAEGPDRDSPEYHPRTGAGPTWVGHGVRKVEVRVAEGNLAGLRLHAIRSEQPAAKGATRPAGAVIPRPGITSRAAWGADESFRTYGQGCTGQPTYAPGVRFAVVHHTVNSNNYAPGDGAALVRAIYYFHTHTNLWCDIGYNFLIDRYGQVFEGHYGGITNPVVGAHALNFNTGSTGVALIGTFQTDTVPPAMYSALRSFLAWKLAYHGINPQSTVVANGQLVNAVSGHRDLNATGCPGDLAYGLLPQLRNQLAGDLRPSIRKAAVVRSGAFYLRTWQTTGAADLIYGFGDPADVPVMGDWDGNGSKTPGIFRNGLWYLRNSNTTGTADLVLGFGNPGDRPVVGDWNGDGRDTPGIVRGGVWYERNSNTTGAADLAFGFGNPGDAPLAGDWDGDGRDTAGVFRQGTWYARNSNTTGAADLAFGFGNPGDVPLVADWNGDRVDTPGVFRGGSWYLRNSNSTGPGDVAFGFGDAGDRPVAWS